MHASRIPLLLRGVCAAMAATMTALLSHLAAGGATPALLGVLVPLLLSLPVCVFLAGRRFGAIRLSVSVLASQFLFHTLFVIGSVPATSAAGVPVSPHASHQQLTGALLGSLPEGTGAEILANGTMWGWHLIAAAATVLFLLRGERTLLHLRELAERLLLWLGFRLRWAQAHPSFPVLTKTATPVHAGWALLRRISQSTTRRRGPPRVFWSELT